MIGSEAANRLHFRCNDFKNDIATPFDSIAKQVELDL
jgi:hypothetical protein